MIAESIKWLLNPFNDSWINLMIAEYIKWLLNTINDYWIHLMITKHIQWLLIIFNDYWLHEITKHILTANYFLSLLTTRNNCWSHYLFEPSVAHSDLSAPVAGLEGRLLFYRKWSSVPVAPPLSVVSWTKCLLVPSVSFCTPRNWCQRLSSHFCCCLFQIQPWGSRL